jgi:hypothetical protein
MYVYENTEGKPKTTIPRRFREYQTWTEDVHMGRAQNESGIAWIMTTFHADAIVALFFMGNRRFATRDEFRNSWWVALLTGGERGEHRRN